MTWRLVRCDIARECPEYLFELEEHRDDEDHQMVFVHMRVHKWSKHTLFKMHREWEIFRRCVQVPLFAVAEADDEKWATFVKFFGFNFLRDVVCENGEHRRLFVNLPAAKEQNNEQHVNPTNPTTNQQSAEPLGSPGRLSDPGLSGRI